MINTIWPQRLSYKLYQRSANNTESGSFIYRTDLMIPSLVWQPIIEKAWIIEKMLNLATNMASTKTEQKTMLAAYQSLPIQIMLIYVLKLFPLTLYRGAQKLLVQYWCKDTVVCQIASNWSMVRKKAAIVFIHIKVLQIVFILNKTSENIHLAGTVIGSCW